MIATRPYSRIERVAGASRRGLLASCALALCLAPNLLARAQASPNGSPRAGSLPPPAARGALGAAQDARTERVAELVARGRAALAKGRPEAALDAFSEAHALSGESFETHVWLLRAWIDQGRINDALNQIDRWVAAGRESSEIDYLLGMAFHRRAKDHIASGVPDRTTTMSFEDAAQYLDAATKADPVRWIDAFGPLAEAAWFTQQNELALTAAKKAVELAPGDSAAHYLLAQIQFSRFVLAEQEQAGSDEANARWTSTIEAFERARQCIGTPRSDEERARLARSGFQLAYARLWRDQVDEAQRLIGDSLGWEPNQDYSALRDSISPSVFRAALERGAELSRLRFGGERPGDALLSWWLGFARFGAGVGGLVESEGAPPTPPDKAAMAKVEPAFQRALALEPDFLNAWYYIGLARYHQGDYAGLLTAFHTLWDVEPSNLVGMLLTDRELNLRILDYVLGWCHEQENELDPAFLCELRVGFFPENWEYWDNLGYFARNAGAALKERFEEGGDEADLVEAKRLFERSLEAYLKARELAPDHPHLLNDAAVILHYYLEREPERVREMYEQARDQAQALIDGGTLEGADLDWARKALADSKANLRVLDGLEEPDLGR